MGLVSYQASQKVENALYQYPAAKLRLEQEREEILHSTARRTEGRQAGRIGDITATKGVKLADLEAKEWARWCMCVSEILALLPEMKANLIKLKYFDRLKTREIAKQLYISPAWYFVLAEQALSDVMLYATQKGLVKPVEVRKDG